MDCLVYSSECVICLQEVDNTLNCHERNQVLIPYLEQSILKLLNLDLSALSALSMTNSVNYGQDDKEGLQLFCKKCFERNVEIHNLFAHIEALGQSLERLKSTIEDQVRESEQTLKEREAQQLNGHDNSDTSNGIKYHLRNEISRGLGLFFPKDVENYIELPFVEETIFEDEVEQAEIENSNDEISQEVTVEDISNKPQQQSEVESSSTQKKYDVKELSISLQRLPRSIVPNTQININSLPPSIRLRRSVTIKRVHKERMTMPKTKLTRSSTEDAVGVNMRQKRKSNKKRTRKECKRYCCDPFNVHVKPKPITAIKRNYVCPMMAIKMGPLYPTVKCRAPICMSCNLKLLNLSTRRPPAPKA